MKSINQNIGKSNWRESVPFRMPKCAKKFILQKEISFTWKVCDKKCHEKVI